MEEPPLIENHDVDTALILEQKKNHHQFFCLTMLPFIPDGELLVTKEKSSSGRLSHIQT